MDKASYSSLIEAARALHVHGDRLSPEKRHRIRAGIRKRAASINLANDDQASDFGNNKSGAGNNSNSKKTQAGKTRAQPRAYGGKFGQKGATNGEQGMPGENPGPDAFIAVVNNLQIGQSVGLPNNSAKVKRLGKGYQLVKMDGSENRVVSDITEAIEWVRQNVKLQPKKGVPASNDNSKPSN